MKASPNTNHAPGNHVSPSWFWWLAVVCGLLAVLLPFWVMIVTSLMSPADTSHYPPRLLPSHWQWSNYAKVFTTIPFARYFLNSLVVASLTTMGLVLTSAMAGYGFARLQFPYKNQWFWLCLVTLMIPPQVNLVPLFFEMKLMHWIDTYWALVIPGIFGAFGVFLMRQWFLGLPKELEEAAWVDGCNPLSVFFRIALPLSLPALVALAIFTFIGSWNSLLWPMIVTQSESLRTLPVGISALKSSYRDVTDWGVLMAATTLSVLPVMALFLIGQKPFVEGLMSGSVKE